MYSRKSRLRPSPTAALPSPLKPLGHGIYAAIDVQRLLAYGANAGFVVGDDGRRSNRYTLEKRAALRPFLGEIRMVSKCHQVCQ